jgi:hypothetical protein
MASYCSGLTAPVQLAIVALEYRTTASSNEQKYRVPVWLAMTGVAITLYDGCGVPVVEPAPTTNL